MKTRLLTVITLVALTASCEPENTPPAAVVFSIPRVGDTTTLFMLEGGNSDDDETSPFALLYRWDTDADGTWDTDYSSRTGYTARFSQTGYRKFALEVMDDDGGTSSVTDSVFILARNQNIDTLTDIRDGQRYRIVKIGQNWWMAENLRFGVPIDVKTAPTGGDLVEFLYFNNDKSYSYYGSLYTWQEANYYPTPVVYRDICPPGWKIPSTDQWSELYKNYPQPFDILYYFGTSSIEGLGVDMTGYYQYGDPLDPMKGEYKRDRYGVRYWTSHYTGQDTTRYFTGINFSRDSCYFVKSHIRPAWIYHPQFPGYIIGFKSPEACYVRCIKQ